MDSTLFIEIVNKSLITVAIISIPILIPGLVTGIMISLFQAVTQISEQTLTFVPKVFITILSLLLTGPWLIRFYSDYFVEIINRLPEIANNIPTN